PHLSDVLRSLSYSLPLFERFPAPGGTPLSHPWPLLKIPHDIEKSRIFGQASFQNSVGFFEDVKIKGHSVPYTPPGQQKIYLTKEEFQAYNYDLWA
ncbi:MAG: hypothetical protein AAB260_04575, partial [Planctomycetota bacterium]